MTKLDYSLKRTSDPAVEPVSLVEAKRHLRVVENDDDQLVSDLIAVARTEVERATGQSLITQTWQLTLDQWPQQIELLHGPVQSVTSITYVDTAGDTQTWGASNYDLHNDSNHAFIVEAYSQTYPAIRGDSRGITVTYVTGHGDAAANVPQSLVQAVLLRLEMEYDGHNADLVEAYERLVHSNYAGGYP